MMSQSILYLVYIYQSNGLQPVPVGRDHAFTDDLRPPQPSSTQAFKWLATELQKPGSDINRLYDGVLVIVNKNNSAHLASTIISVSDQYGFEKLPEELPLEVVHSLNLAGFRDKEAWCEAVLLRK